ncbi:zinc ABC transporter substrate-binding protein [Enterococcus thailandicus]|uniref:metal ABC transporter substrate-binding protein n=1 Tax=Enterococcus TaxID=1350 RepID=UPI0022EBFBB3|nr:zinc ABC transporter substrate-binding protein [Enterococcus thailandicus]MDA3972839.1 zinc ABC transporter substrate-binding protein [Enterococcus thailandicus]MDA3975727.1 zinc ABC transporter substrate-binding protein [Enterococcus thailandicus]MDA3980299.1 zinc ABC transporter substrate-binding protein [Enterococcus thailandicus]
MKKSKLLILLFALGIFLVGCSTKSEKSEQTKDGKLTVVATNSILADMAKEVGKDKVTIHSIVPVGTDPHEYEVLPEDIKKASDAKVILYNGLNLETGNGWFNNLMETAKKVEDEDYFAVSREVEPLYLTSAGQETQADPHAWLDVSNGIKYVEEITRILSEKDPENKEVYEKNSQEYRKKLESLDQQAKESFATISEEKKLLVTSEGAFKYFSKAYQLPAAYIWEINTESQGTPDQMSAIIDQVKASKVPGLFVESSVDPRSMERVSKETGVPIAEKLFTDSVAKSGETGDSYYGMMKWNIEAIHDGLSK